MYLTEHNNKVRCNINITGQWVKTSVIAIKTLGSAITGLRSNFSIQGKGYAYGVNFIQVNLTQIFGSGNEPTQSEMDELIEILGGWFDGEITATQKQLTIWHLNLIRKNRNAIIQLGGTV